MDLVIGFLLGAVPALFVGWFGREVIMTGRRMMSIFEQKPVPSVTNPYVRPRPGSSPDVIIQPKSPQQLQMEAYEKLKRGELN